MASQYDREFAAIPSLSALRPHTSPSHTTNFTHYLSLTGRHLAQTHTKWLQENGCEKYLYDVQRYGRDTDHADLASCFMMKRCQGEYVNWQKTLRKMGGEGGVDELYTLAQCWERNVGIGDKVKFPSFVKYLDDVKDAPF